MDILQQLTEANKKRVTAFGHTIEGWSLPEWGNALAGEVGELCNVIKKVHRGDYTLAEANDKKLLADEAADIVCYLDLLCQKAGISLREAVVHKFNEVSDRVKSEIKISLN